ncbi:MAG: methyltransferase [Nocardioides sp.]
MDARDRLEQMIIGHRVAAAIAAAVDVGLVDALAAGPLSAEDAAAAASTHPDTTQRVLHALATAGVVSEADGTFALTDVGEPLRSGVPGSLAPQALIQADPAVWDSWGNLAHTLRTGETAFSALHGKDVWAHRAEHPDRSATFDAFMTARSSMVAGAVAAAYDFSGRTHVVDVGGGQGTLLATVLRTQPDLTGAVFDQPHVVAPVAPPDLEGRWSAVGGSFFESVPPADCYLLKWILHDWLDEECVTILRRCRESLEPGGVVLVVELLLDRPGHESATAWMDMQMLVVAGGRERTRAEYGALFSAAGLRLSRVLDTGTPFAVLEAVAGS